VTAALREAVRNDVDVVIMAAHGKGLIRRWVAGSTAHSMIRDAQVPVIVVGADGSFSAPRPEPVRRILIALDGSRRAEHTFEIALTLADTCGAEIVLLRVIPQSAAFGAYRSGAGERHNLSWQVQMAAAQRYLRRTANRMKQRSRVVDSRVVLSHRSTARTIAANASAFNADLLAVATRKDASKRWLGSVAERVVQFASMPVLVVAA
jgi:nucleotide-binding universal stress UspA family protein